MSARRVTGIVGSTVASLLFCVAACAGATPLTTKLVATGLSAPLFVTYAPGDFSRIFIVEQGGTIRILDITVDPPVLAPTAFIDISSIISSGGEQGLLGLAFHPNYSTNGFFYVNHTDTSGGTVVARYTVSANPDLADAGSRLEVLKVSQPQFNHNGGWIGFGPDGFLYIGMGDGGASDDFGSGHTPDTGNAQDITNNLLGKMLRIDIDGDDFPGDTTRNYAIPTDNPFVGISGDDEIWAFGLRNPWRNAFDRQTGDLYIADVGQDAFEEIDFQSASSAGGENWGWRCREGANDFTIVPTTGCGAQTLLDPIYEYNHTVGCSITGGEVYRGCAIPDLQGTYFFADLNCSGGDSPIWSFDGGAGVLNFQDRTAELAPGGGLNITGVASFGLDAQGEMYICDLFDGEVFKIIPATGSGDCAVPAVSDWGVIIITLTLLAISTVLIRRDEQRVSR